MEFRWAVNCNKEAETIRRT
jgi:hypothetical protein